MLRYFLFLLFVLAIAECAVLYWLASEIGILATIGLLLVTGIVGVALARWQGTLALGRMQLEMAQGHMPADTLLDGVLILVAAVLLFLPGIITDVAGLSLLLPPVRTGAKKLLRHRFARDGQSRFYSPNWDTMPVTPDRIIDVEVIETRSSDV